MRKRYLLAFEIQRMLARAHFKTGPFNSEAEAQAALGDNAGVVKQGSDGLWYYSDSASGQEQYYTQQNQEFGEEAMAFNEDLAMAQLEIAGAQVEIAQRQQAMSEEQYDYWKTTFQPLEKDVAEAATVGIDPAQAAARAGSDVTATFAKSKEQAARDMSRMGIDASSGRYQQQQDAMAIAQAAAEAGAKSSARNVTTDVNYQRQLNAVSIGRNLPSTSASMSQGAANTYGAAAGTQRGAASTYQQGIDTQIGVNNQGVQSAQFNQSMDANQAAGNSAAIAGVTGAVTQAGALATTKYIAVCIPDGGMVDMPSGPAMPIASIRAGDFVVGYDGEPTEVLWKNEYLEKKEGGDKDFVALVLEGGLHVRACVNHLVDSRPAGQYRVGDTVAGRAIVAVESMLHVRRSYDLLTASKHGGYRMFGVPVHSMIPDLVEKSAERMKKTYVEVEGA